MDTTTCLGKGQMGSLKNKNKKQELRLMVWHGGRIMVVVPACKNAREQRREDLMSRVVAVLHLKIPCLPKAYQLLLLGISMVREKNPFILPLSTEEPLLLERETNGLGAGENSVSNMVLQAGSTSLDS